MRPCGAGAKRKAIGLSNPVGSEAEIRSGRVVPGFLCEVETPFRPGVRCPRRDARSRERSYPQDDRISRTQGGARGLQGDGRADREAPVHATGALGRATPPDADQANVGALFTGKVHLACEGAARSAGAGRCRPDATWPLRSPLAPSAVAGAAGVMAARAALVVLGAIVVAVDAAVALHALFRRHDANAVGTRALHHFNIVRHQSAPSATASSAAPCGSTMCSIMLVRISRTWQSGMA